MFTQLLNKRTLLSKTAALLVSLLAGGLLCPTLAVAQSLPDANRWMTTGDSLRQVGWYDSSTWYVERAAGVYRRLTRWQEYVHSLTIIATNYTDSGELARAQWYAEEALTYGRQHLAPGNLEMSRAYLARSNILIYQKQYDSARQYYQLAVADQESAQAYPPSYIAQSYRTAGRILSGLHEMDSARWYYHRALKLLNVSASTAPPVVAELYLQLGASYGDEYQYDSAAYYYKKSFTLLRETQQASHPLMMNVYANLAVDFYARSDFDQSLSYFLKALTIQKRFFGDNTRTADCYRNVGTLYIKKRAFSKAHGYLSQAVKLLEHSDNQLSLASAYQALGTNANYNKDFLLGRASLRKALDAWQTFNQQDSALLYRILNDIGLGYEKAGNTDSAAIYFRRTLATAQQVKQKNNVSIAIYHYNVGGTYADDGQFDEASSHIKQALSLRQSMFGNKHAEVASSWTALGEIYHQQGNKNQALRSFQRALAANVIDFDDTLFTHNPTASAKYLDAYELLDALYYKASVLLADQATAAEALLALNTLCLSDSVIDQLQPTYQTQDDQITLKERAKETYQLAVDASLRLFRQWNDQAYARQAFYFSEKSKASVLTQALTELSAQHQAGIPDHLLAQERALEIDRAYYSSRIQTELTRSATDSFQLSYYQTHLFDINRQYDSLIRLLEVQHPKYYTLKYRNPVIAVPQLQGQLSENTRLVSSFLSDSLLYQFVVTRDTLLVVEQAYDSTLAQTIASLRSTLTPEAITQLSQETYRTYTQSAAWLYQVLLGAVLSSVPVDKPSPNPLQLIIIADGALGYVPYDILLTQPVAPEVPDYRHLSYLLNDYDVSYGYSATWLFQPLEKQASQAPQKLIAFASASSSDELPDESSALVWNRNEVDKVSNHVATQLYTGPQAQEQRFKQEANQYQFIHLAMHGYADSEDPLASKLVFSSREDTIHHEDNILYAHELYDMQLSADLAVLSACQTGSGVLAEGEGILSLARAFAYAGCASVVMSHWAADDESTATLMDYFYQYLAEGKPKDQALSQAKRRFLTEAPAALTHPYYWGNFMLVGEAIPITFPHRDRIAYLIAGGILLTIVAVAIGRRLV